MKLWVDRPPLGPDLKSDAKDPLIGNHYENTAAKFIVPRPGVKDLEFKGLSAFVATKGMLYLFYPSISAVNLIADETSIIYQP